MDIESIVVEYFKAYSLSLVGHRCKTQNSNIGGSPFPISLLHQLSNTDTNLHVVKGENTAAASSSHVSFHACRAQRSGRKRLQETDSRHPRKQMWWNLSICGGWWCEEGQSHYNYGALPAQKSFYTHALSFSEGLNNSILHWPPHLHLHAMKDTAWLENKSCLTPRPSSALDVFSEIQDSHKITAYYYKTTAGPLSNISPVWIERFTSSWDLHSCRLLMGVEDVCMLNERVCIKHHVWTPGNKHPQ